MRIDLTAPEPALLRTSLVCGYPGAGKTLFQATYPRVAWIGSAREGGHKTIRHMDPSLLYEPGVYPEVFAVSSIAEVRNHLDKDILPLVATGRIRTIILEVSFYSDDIVTGLKRTLKAATDGKDNGWQVYGTLESHIMGLDAELKRYSWLQIGYNTLAAVGDDAKVPGGVVIAGRALAKKLPAAVDLFGYMRQEEAGKGPDRILHLEAYGHWQARHRFGRRLPGIIRNPTYRKLEQLIVGTHWTDDDGNVLTREELAAAHVPVAVPPAPSAQTETQVEEPLAPLPGLPPL